MKTDGHKTILYCKHCIHYDICRLNTACSSYKPSSQKEIIDILENINEKLDKLMAYSYINSVWKDNILNIACSAYKPSPQKEIIDLLENINDKLSLLLEKKNTEEEL